MSAAGEPFRIARNPDPDSSLPYLLRLPTVPTVFCDSRKVAEDFTHRFLAAAVAEHGA